MDGAALRTRFNLTRSQRSSGARRTLKSLVMQRFPVIMLLVGCTTVAALACEGVLAPQHSALGDLRRQATAGNGPFIGRVREHDSFGRCLRATPMVAGVRVEVGLWDGSPAFYRDSLTHHPPSAPDDPRFQLLAHTITDAEGRFRFDNMPRRVAYAMRVNPSKGAPWEVSYGETMYGVPTGGDLEDFPTLCVQSRRSTGPGRPAPR
jgi:hypothetical protein